MARRRKQTLVDRISNLSIVSLVVNPVTLMIAVSIVSMFLWNKYQHRVDAKTGVALSRHNLRINQPPQWIKTDIRDVAIRESRLGEIKLGESKAVEMVAASFAVQPWVKKVENVRKTGSGIHVKVQYRIPVALVEIGKEQLVPVDDETIVLDSRDFKDSDLADYWRIYMPNPLTAGLAPGRGWDDLRVSDSIAIAKVWTGARKDAGFIHIVNRSQPTRDRLRIGFYELWTRRGTIVIWGKPPGMEQTGEASAADKIAAIQAYIATHGELDSQSYRVFDVRTGTLKPSTTKLAADKSEFVPRNSRIR